MKAIVERFVLVATIALVCAYATVASGQTSRSPAGSCDACDANCDSVRNAADIGPFVARLADGVVGCSGCGGDVDVNDVVDGRDIQGFVGCLIGGPVGACCSSAASCVETSEGQCGGAWLGAASACDVGACAFGNLTAYRPQHGTGYFPFTRTAVAEADEESDRRGPGIRINATGDLDPAGEDDLIEVVVETTRPGIALSLQRSDAALRVWTTRDKQAGSEIAFTGDRTGPLALAGASLTVWVEWAAASQGVAELHLEPTTGAYSLDVLKFHTFRSIVMALGGEGQVPSVPVDANHGTFVVGIALYAQGYDVHLYDEDNVTANGSGATLNEVVTAVRDRGVDQVAIFGYSHGGGSTHDLAERLDNDRAGIGEFEIVATSYVDGVGNSSDFDISQEVRRPPSTDYHANQYQVGSFADFGLDGGPVPGSDPPPTGRNVETILGTGVTHFTVDDEPIVRTFVESNLATRVTP